MNQTNPPNPRYGFFYHQFDAKFYVVSGWNDIDSPPLRSQRDMLALDLSFLNMENANATWQTIIPDLSVYKFQTRDTTPTISYNNYVMIQFCN